MSKRFCIFLIVVSCLTVNVVKAGCLSGRAIVSGKPDYPPISWTRHDEITGLGYDVIRKILSELEIYAVTAPPQPWKRVLRLAEEGEIDIVVGVRDSEERSKYLSFVATPIIGSAQNIIFMKGAEIKAKEDLPDKVGGILLGETYTPQFNQFASAALQLEPVLSLKQNLHKLNLGRIDYFIAPLLPTIHYIRKNNMNLDVQFIAQPVFTVEEKIAISKKSSCFEYLERIEEKLIKLREELFVNDLFDMQTQEWDVFEYLK